MSGKADKGLKSPGMALVEAAQRAQKAAPRIPAETASPTASTEEACGSQQWAPYEKVGFLQRETLNIGRILRTEGCEKPLQALDKKQISDCLISVLRMSIALRSTLERSPEDPGGYHAERLHGINPVRVKRPAGTILQLALPPLLATRFAGGYDLYWWAKAAIIEFGKEHDIFNPSSERALIIYKRYMSADRKRAALDNDNFEAKRITNAICEGIGRDDNCQSMSFLYTSVDSACEGLEATVIAFNDLPFFIPYLQNPIPDDPDFLAYF